MVSLNDLSTLGLEIDRDEPYCQRAKLDTGPLCNYNCSFCYYQGDLHKKTDLSVILGRLDYLYTCGINEVDLSGGESSLRPDWFELLDECKKRGMKISTVSNGYKFADIEFLRKSQEHGLEEILFSVHGFDKESHNKIVDHTHGFDRIITAIHNAKSLGMVVRINCVVTKDNYTQLDTKFVSLMLELLPLEVNFLTLNFWGNIKDLDYVPYADVTQAIKNAIDKLGVIKYINVRYTPYCYMEGYEKYVCNTYQHIYDVFDWNMAVYDEKIAPLDYRKDNLLALYQAAGNDRARSYKKPQECAQCKYFYVCDGMEKEINDLPFPVAGTKIKAINFARKGFYEDQRSNTDS